jgi:hypothetical protein
MASSLWKNGVIISEYALVLRRINDLSKGKVWKVVNLALKREAKKVTRVEKKFHTIHNLQEDEECIYVDCRRTNHV